MLLTTCELGFRIHCKCHFSLRVEHQSCLVVLGTNLRLILWVAEISGMEICIRFEMPQFWLLHISIRFSMFKSGNLIYAILPKCLIARVLPKGGGFQPILAPFPYFFLAAKMPLIKSSGVLSVCVCVCVQVEILPHSKLLQPTHKWGLLLTTFDYFWLLMTTFNV